MALLNLSSSSLTGSQIITLTCISLSTFLAFIVFSLQAPFFPQEAEKKNLTALEYGSIFGFYELVGVLTAPFVGAHIGSHGPKSTLLGGLGVGGISTIAYGFLDKVPDHWGFFFLCCALRAVESISNSVIYSSAFTYAAKEISNGLGTATAVIETSCAVAIAIGPVCGAPLYALGGFILPFAVVGGVHFLFIPFLYLLLPSNNSSTSIPESKNLLGFFMLLKLPTIALYSFCIFLTTLGVSSTLTVLEPGIRSFHLSQLEIGGIFFAYAGTYAVFSITIGQVIDRVGHGDLVTILGSGIQAFAFLFIGPPIFMPFEPQVWITIVGLIIFGLGQGAVTVSSYSNMMQFVARTFGGTEADTSLEANGLLGSIFLASMASGGFFGPICAGAIFDVYGFRVSTILSLITYIILFCLLMIIRVKPRLLPEKSPLLGERKDKFSNHKIYK